MYPTKTQISKDMHFYRIKTRPTTRDKKNIMCIEDYSLPKQTVYNVLDLKLNMSSTPNLSHYQLQNYSSSKNGIGFGDKLYRT